MSLRLEQSQVEPTGPLTLRARFRAKNTSQHAWNGVDGLAFSYQVFDPSTDNLLIDGTRTPLTQTVAPGESVALDIDVRVPPGDGRYRIFVSAMKENVAWLYERGWRFLALDVEVCDGRVIVRRSRESTMTRLRANRWLRTFLRAFHLPFRSTIANRSLIVSMVRRDVLSRYRGSFAGVFWSVLSPLMLMATYFFVFGIVLQARFGNDTSRSGFALYFLAGMLPWLPFSEAVGRSASVLLEHRNFIKKLIFPVETLPVNITVSGLFTQAIATVLFLLVLLIIREQVPLSAFLLPLLLIPQILFTLGLCWFLAALGVFVRDLGQVMGFLLTLWFFLTPICYPEQSLPREVEPYLRLNPMVVLVRAYRAVLLDGHAPDFVGLGNLYILSFIVFICGFAFFHKLRRSFADVI